jgi:hypothetical protein
MEIISGTLSGGAMEIISEFSLKVQEDRRMS